MISVIIPSYNRSNYLAQLLNSILSQSYADIEIIVVDDNSKDQTEAMMFEYLQNYPVIKYFKNRENMGCGYNRSFGLKKSQGDYIIFADDDDYYIDNSFFEKAIQIFQMGKKISFVAGNVRIKNEKTGELNENKLNISGHTDQLKYLNGFQYLYNKPISLFSSLFSRKILEQSGVYDMEMVNDSSIYLRSLLYGSAFIMDDMIGIYRIHDQNITNSLDSNFILQNLQEKKYVQKIAQAQNLLSDPDEWMKKQFLLTIVYYFSSSRINFSDLKKMTQWVNKAITKNKNVVSLLVLKFYIKNKMRFI
jgi:glycosyltransferase involved in cell wall biosynthesis